MQQEEIKRLSEQYAGIDQSNLQVNKVTVLSLTKKVQELHLAFLEKDRELQIAINDKEIAEDTFKAQLAAIEEERDQLKSAHSLLKTEADTLRSHLDTVRHTSLQDDQSSLQTDENLILRERLAKSEQDQELLRKKLDELSTEFARQRSEREHEKIERIRAQEELTSVKSVMKIREVQVKQLDEMSHENQALLDRLEKLNQEVSGLRESRQEENKEEGEISIDFKEKLHSLSHALDEIRKQNSELTRELSTAKDSGQGAQEAKGNVVFQRLYSSISKARALLLVIVNQLELNSMLFRTTGGDKGLEGNLAGNKRTRN